MKTLLLCRGKSQRPYPLPNGDVYDSTGELVDQAGASLWKSDHVNTDSTVTYKGGMLAPISCLGIVGDRITSTGAKKKGILLFQLLRPYDVPPVSVDEVSEQMKILPSLIPNPNHNNERWVSHVWVHAGGITWNFSHACQTVLEKEPEREFTKLMNCLPNYGEVVNFILT